MHKNILPLALFLLTLSAQAQEEPQRAGFHEHDGFFLSLCLGPASGKYEDQVTGSGPFGGWTLTFSGPGTAFDVRIGGTIADNLILSGDLIARSLVNPKITVEGDETITVSDASFTPALVGLGLTYYVSPQNVFVSGTLGFSRLTLEYRRSGMMMTQRTDFGFGMNVRVGKEWWLGADWGLGIAGSFGWMTVKKSGEVYTDDVTGYSLGLQVSATYN